VDPYKVYGLRLTSKTNNTKSVSAGVSTVIFDFDGTLLTLPVDWAALKTEITKLSDLSVGPDKIHFSKLLKKLRKQGRIDIFERVQGTIKRVEAKSITKAKINQQIVNCYKKCFTKKMNIAIFTTNYKETVLKAVEKFGLPHPHLLIGREDVENTKPDIEGMEKILAFFKIGPERVVMIGDSWKDSEVARKAGIKFVNVEDVYLIKKLFK